MKKMKHKNNSVIWARSKRLACLIGVSSTAMISFSPSAMAQEEVENAQEDTDEIVVSGIRASLQRAQDIKRNSDGVVDAISAEDIGKFPDTNLAESLQRISGVSINRVNGEGSEVTVRGFGAQFNLVTLNGRTLPGADVALVGTDGAGANGNSRAFDFSNLASESVAGIQVYKTGKAINQSGGIGAVVNIQTARPLDAVSGLSGSIGAKAVHDSSVVGGSDITPEFSGLLNWTNDAGNFGIGLFGSYQKRDSSAVATEVAQWQIFPASQFLAPGQFVTPATAITNSPDPNQLIAVPTDSRYHFSEFERERINGQLVLQFRPTDTLTFTADALYARNDQEEQRASLSNWFNRPFTQVEFEQNPVIAATTFLAETINGAKDYAVTQAERRTRDELYSFGLNVEWEASDSLKFVFDGHFSESQVTPRTNTDQFGAQSQVEVGLGAPIVASQTLRFTPDGVPQQTVVFDDSVNSDGNGVFDINDVSTTVANLSSISQTNQIEEFDARGIWELDDRSTFTAGASYRNQDNRTVNTQRRQILGNWGAENPGDVATIAPGILEQFCLTCQFDDFNLGVQNDSPTSQSFFGDTSDLFDLVSAAYASADGTPTDFLAGVDNQPFILSVADGSVSEEIISVYGQFDTSFAVGNSEAKISVGLRYEDTNVTSSAVLTAPTALIQTGDNDFATNTATSSSVVNVSAGYSNFLPHIDFSIDLKPDLIFRASYSNTIARASFGQLSAVSTVNTPSSPTALGGIYTGSSGNPGLLPLESDNFDASLEWYYGPSSFVAVGAFHKRVDNFIGNGQVTQNLFGLQDPSSGAAGTFSGTALDLLATAGAVNSLGNFFAATALLANGTSEADTLAMINANLQADGQLDPAFVQNLDSTLDIATAAGDPLAQFAVSQPINTNNGRISGIELAGQHFFGETGFGIAASYTFVDGNVDFDVGAAPGTNQFALTGLSDTANVTLIFEKYGLSSRLSYNWRDSFLASTNRGSGFTNPVFIDSFEQLDLNVSYNITEDLAVSFEAINITGENTRSFGRTRVQTFFGQEQSPRYVLGVRYNF